VADLSPTTGEQYYSGDWTDIQDTLRVFNIGEGRMAKIDQPMVNRFQETVDRESDAILEDVYHTPFRAMNQMQPDGTTKRVFPGDLRRYTRYWTAALLLLTEFQQLEQNLTDQMSSTIDDSKKSVFALKRYTHRVPGQRRKSHFSRTIPPNFQPPSIPEPDF
jgi:hypothetical protein